MTKIDLGVEPLNLSTKELTARAILEPLIDLAEEVAAQRFQQQNNRQEHSFQGPCPSEIFKTDVDFSNTI